MYDMMSNNTLKLAGTVENDPVFYHEVYDEKFYQFTLEVPRLSENADKIPVLISEKIMKGLKAGDIISLNGQVRTYNKINGTDRKLLVYAFVRDYSVITAEELAEIKNPNEVELKGFLCKDPIYRKTPMGREIADLLLAVNRTYKKSDYIPTIAWGRNAQFCSEQKVGTHICITGRLQSREYVKKTDSSEVTHVAYEVSANRVKLMDENTDKAE